MNVERASDSDIMKLQHMDQNFLSSDDILPCYDNKNGNEIYVLKNNDKIMSRIKYSKQRIFDIDNINSIYLWDLMGYNESIDAEIKLLRDTLSHIRNKYDNYHIYVLSNDNDLQLYERFGFKQNMLNRNIKSIICDQCYVKDNAIIDNGKKLYHMEYQIGGSIIKSHIKNKYYKYIKEGKKTIDGRLNRGKYAKLKKGDILYFNDICTKINKIVKYDNFKDMLNNEEVKNIFPDMLHKNEGLNIYNKFYTDFDQELFGVVAIHLKLA